uniref:Uncharacterized protein n=1 Tax=Arundo donax TaxID=35708 RepID=A0A0A8ZXY1_ARUDO
MSWDWEADSSTLPCSDFIVTAAE